MECSPLMTNTRRLWRKWKFLKTILVRSCFINFKNNIFLTYLSITWPSSSLGKMFSSLCSINEGSVSSFSRGGWQWMELVGVKSRHWWVWLAQLVELCPLLSTTKWWAVRVPTGSVGLLVRNTTAKWGLMSPLILHTKEVNNCTGLDGESQL